MFKENILLPNIEAVKKFVKLTNQCDFPVNLISDKYIINAKSIMGIFGLDLSSPLQVEVTNDCSNEFKEKLKEFTQTVQAV